MAQQRWTNRILLITPSSRRTIAIRRVEVLCPVRRNSTLCCCKGHPAGFHFVGKVVLYLVFDLEVPFVQGDGRRPAIGKNNASFL